MDDSLSLDQLCYPGKAVEIRSAGVTLGLVVTAVADSTLVVAGGCPGEGVCEVRVTFMSEPYIATGEVRHLDHGFEVVVDDGFSHLNDRSAPRVSVDLNGTYYLRPPTAGVPIEIVDLSVSGLAILPTAVVAPQPFERRMISFVLEGRQIKTVVELVGVEPRVLRGRFMKLSVSDEEAIAGYVMARQVAERHALSLLEVRTPSALDVLARRRYPLLDGVFIHEHAIELSARGIEAQLQLPSPLTERDRLATALASVVGAIRLGDINDVFHYLSRSGFDVEVVDLAALGFLVLHARLYEFDLAELVASILGVRFQGTLPGRLLRGSDVDGYVAGSYVFRDNNGLEWRLLCRSLGVGLYSLNGEHQDIDGSCDRGAGADSLSAGGGLTAAQVGQWITPLAMAELISSPDHPLLLGYWYQDLEISRQIEEILYEPATSGESG